jgi:hypothetical protein
VAVRDHVVVTYYLSSRGNPVVHVYGFYSRDQAKDVRTRMVEKYGKKKDGFQAFRTKYIGGFWI